MLRRIAPLPQLVVRFSTRRADALSLAKLMAVPTSIDFRDMEVEMPILSVRKMIRKRNLVQFEDDGGFIKNQDTGRTTKFYECGGAYFLKLRIDDPSVAEQWLGTGLPEPASSSKGKGSGSSFPRPGQ